MMMTLRLQVVIATILIPTVAVGYSENVETGQAPWTPPPATGLSSWIRPDQPIEKDVFLHMLLDHYGDGTDITKSQIQELMDAVRLHGNTNAATRTADGNHDNVTVCENWMTDIECLQTKCLSVEELFALHGYEDVAVNASVLRELAPALLYSAQNHNCVTTETTAEQKPDTREVWGYSFLCVTVINLCSLMGLIFLPLMHKAFYKSLLMFMVALAVGTLSGSSLLFLLPECFDMMNEENPGYHDYIWKCTTVIAGIYMFFLVERLLKIIMDWRKKLVAFDSDSSSIDRVSASNNFYSPLKRAGDESTMENSPISSLKTRSVHRDESMNMSFSVPRSPKDKTFTLPGSPKDAKKKKPEKLVINETQPGSEARLVTDQSEASLPEVRFHLPADSDGGVVNVAPCPASSSSVGVSMVTEPENSANQSTSLDQRGLTPNDSFSYLRPNNSETRLLDKIALRFTRASQEDDTCPPTPSNSTSSKGEIKPVAWMVIFGDGLHNFIDGLSIGAAFSKNILAGVSVSVAVVCEELPHELGDFAVLLNSGMSMRQALSYNFLSACMCYLGLVIGIVVGEMTAGSSWIFALAGGMFLYISLVDMLPEVNHAAEIEEKETGRTWAVFFIQNAGLLTGYGIMLIMANFAEHIQFTAGHSSN